MKHGMNGEKAFIDTKVRLESEGLIVREVVVDIDDLIESCRKMD